MAVVYQGDTGDGYVLLEGYGHLTLDDWATAIAAQIADGRWQSPTVFDVIDPFAKLSFAHTAAVIARSVRELIGEHGERGPLAIVLATPELYDEGHAYVETVRAGLPHRIQVFATRADAVAWLKSRSGQSLHSRRSTGP
jgi:hypothetical protein